MSFKQDIKPPFVSPGQLARIRPGRMTHGNCYVRLVEGDLFTLVCDTHLSSCAARSDLIVTKAGKADFIPWRLSRPGGYVELDDGSTVIFSRDELPLWHVAASGAVRQAAPWEALPASWQHHGVYVEDATGREWSSDVGQRWARALLARHGIGERPLLVDVLPYLMSNDMDLEAVVKVMQADQAGRNL